MTTPSLTVLSRSSYALSKKCNCLHAWFQSDLSYSYSDATHVSPWSTPVPGYVPFILGYFNGFPILRSTAEDNEAWTELT